MSLYTWLPAQEAFVDTLVSLGLSMEFRNSFARISYSGSRFGTSTFRTQTISTSPTGFDHTLEADAQYRSSSPDLNSAELPPID